MNDVSYTKKKNIDLMDIDTEEIYTNDEAYPIVLLTNGLKIKLTQAEIAVKEVYKAVAKEAPLIAQLNQSTSKGCRYVVDATESTIKAIENGDIKLTTDKTGTKIYAQIKESNGNFGSKLPIKKEYFRKNMDPVQITNALQIKALQEQLQTIADQICVIDQSVHEVLQGQQNDRIGLYYSGKALFLEAQNIKDEEMKKIMTAQSLRALSEATFQLTLTMSSDIQYLINKEYENIKGKRTIEIDKRMKSINQSFAVIHQSTMLRAAIYCNDDELSAMSAVLNEYSSFIERMVVENATLLAQCDITDTGTEKGVWNTRANLKLDVSEFAKQINNQEKTLYLGILKEND